MSNLLNSNDGYSLLGEEDFVVVGNTPQLSHKLSELGGSQDSQHPVSSKSQVPKYNYKSIVTHRSPNMLDLKNKKVLSVEELEEGLEEELEEGLEEELEEGLEEEPEEGLEEELEEGLEEELEEGLENILISANAVLNSDKDKVHKNWKYYSIGATFGVVALAMCLSKK